jgi:hypothetical protein
MKKVEFLIIGAQKCGTSSLFHWLSQHPALEACSKKEPHYFSKTTLTTNSINNYHRLFKDESKIWFEASTSYSNALHEPEDIVANIYNYNPEMKFIYIVRDPIERIISAYKHYRRRGIIKGSLENALNTMPSLLSISQYQLQYNVYLRTFEANQFHIINFEDIINKTTQTQVLSDLTRFLDITHYGDISFSHRNNHLEVKNTHYKLDKLGHIGNIISRFYKVKITKEDLMFKNRKIWENYFSDISDPKNLF